MTTRTQKATIGCAAILALISQAAPGASFIYLLTGDDGVGHENRWNNAANWQLVSGVDDGVAGIPDGLDTFSMDRTPNASNATRLSNGGSPPTTIAGITGTGTGNQDIVLKHAIDLTIGDLTVLAAGATGAFTIREERDRSLTIAGVLSGDGDLLIHRDSGFSDGLDPDELITLTGSSLNTISGSIRLWNSNNKADAEAQPCYFVADKVGAFGQAATLTLEGRAGANGGPTSLQFTANTVGGEGAIDDDATAFYIGAKGLLNVDTGVNEDIGEGNLFLDLTGSGTYTEVAPGTYDNSEDWIIGDGTVTVIPESSSFALAALGLLGLIRRKR